MTHTSRRSFLASSPGMAALALPEWPFIACVSKPKLSFSTLGCPAWSLAAILKTAVDNGYQGVELRGLEKEMVWDVFNMWIDSHEDVGELYRRLKKYIRHTHIKDGRIENGKHRYVQVGQGEAPLQKAIPALARGGYQGFYSFEWEKRWHPELEEPELAIAQYPKAMKAYF